MSRKRHITPDGQLTLIVDSDGEGCTLWFKGYPARVFGAAITALWHEYDEEEAVSDFLDGLFRDEIPIIIRKKGAEIVDVWPHEDPENDPQIGSPPPGESFELRYWSGSQKKEA